MNKVNNCFVSVDQKADWRRRALLILMTVLMMLSVLPISAFAGDEHEGIVGIVTDEELGELDEATGEGLDDTGSALVVDLAEPTQPFSSDSLELIEVEPSIISAANADNVCSIGSVGYQTLTEALSAATNGQTITLLAHIEHNRGIIISGMSVTINLNGYILNVRSSNANAIEVGSGELRMNNSSGGELNAYSTSGTTCGVYVHGAGSFASLSNATGYSYGAYADVGNIEVFGNATSIRPGADAAGIGAYARNGGTVVVRGDAVGTHRGAFASAGTVTVYGNAIAENSVTETSGIGAITQNGGIVQINKNVTATYVGAMATTGTVTVGGTVSAIKPGSTSSGTGAYAENGGTVTVEGNITASYMGANSRGVGSRVNAKSNISSNRSGATASQSGVVVISGSVLDVPYRGVEVYDAASITVAGNITATLSAGSSIGIYCRAASVTVTGNVVACSPVYADASSVLIGGNVSGVNYGAYAFNSSLVTIDGFIIFEGGTPSVPYVVVGTLARTLEQYEPSSTKPSYREYTFEGSFVWVKVPESSGPPRSGDLDGDGFVTLTEALLVARVVVGSATLNAGQFAAADMDADGYITMTDVLLIMRKALNLPI